MTERPDDTEGDSHPGSVSIDTHSDSSSVDSRSGSSDPDSHLDAPTAPTAPWTRSDPAWPVEETETLFETPWVDAGREELRRPTGETATYYWARQEPAVAVVAHDREADELVLVEQYRPRFRRRFVSCPGGGVEEGESPTAAARRELREETGYRAGRVDHLGAYHPAGMVRLTRHVCYASDLRDGDADPDPGEELVVHRRDPETALADALGSVATGWTVTPLLWARERELL